MKFYKIFPFQLLFRLKFYVQFKISFFLFFLFCLLFGFQFTLAKIEKIPVGSKYAKKSDESFIEKNMKIRENMIKISHELGVTCNYCHDVSNFKNNNNPHYKIAKKHMVVTKLINEKGFKGNPTITCYICHKGNAKPKNKIEK